MSILSDNEMRDLCRRFVVLKHEPDGVKIEIDTLGAERSLRRADTDTRRAILAEVMEFVRAVASSVLSEIKEKLRTTEQIDGINPDSP